MTLVLREALTGSLSLTAAARMAINDASELYDNEDALARRKAQTAYEQDRPAYWSTATYHAQRASQLQIAVNEMALRKALACTYKPGSDWIAALDTLVPLNVKAATALSVAYADYGLWRDEPELLLRRFRRMPK